jgi:death on curing protein
MRYLTVDDVVKANRTALRPGENEAINFGLLESAVLRPQTTIDGQDAYPDIHTKAAVLMYSLANNHAFGAANKRTAVLSTRLFYNLNGLDMVIADIDLFHLALDVATKIYDTTELAGRLKELVVPLELPTE